MKGITLLYTISLLSAAVFTSCTGEAENKGKSINVDSSNISGAAPVHYGPDDPKDTTRSLDTSDDTGRRANTSTKQDSLPR